MIAKIKQDLPASIVVFLVALPLCLGVALASGAPLISGLIAGIIGGIVVGSLSGSQTSVSGPAAGLAAVVLSSITQLGAFDVFLLAVVLAGVIQLIAGAAKTGFIANYIPSNVIKGLLAAIGIILIMKQIPHAVGYDADPENDFSFIQPDGENTFSELLNIFSYFSIGAIIISAISLLMLIYWDKTPMRKFKFFPASLFVVILGIVMNQVFAQFAPSLHISASHLVSIPKIEGINSIITFPAFEAITNYKVWVVAFTVAIIASLETLLNLEAVDNIDPHKRQSPPNRELLAQGAGNILSGLIGGIPITSVIVRSSVNIHSGAKTKASAILHGVFLLVSVLLLSPLMNQIPLASLAAILLVTGYKLAKVSLFKEMYKKGWNQFIPFVATILAIVFTDLLIGIVIGMVISIFFLLKSNYKNPFTLENEKLYIGETVRLELSDEVSFLNKARIKDALWAIPENGRVIIDASFSTFIDNDVLEIIQDFKSTVAVERKIQVNIIGLKDKYALDDHIQFVNILDKEAQDKLSPDEILNLLKKGNERFINGKWSEKYFRHQVNATSFGQNPMAVVVSCIDSRTSPELIFDSGIGDLLSIRIAGNIINKEIIGSLELACSKIGTKLIVVLGHSNCGAVNAAVSSLKEGNIHSVTEKIEKAIVQCGCSRDEITEESGKLNTVIRQNVYNSIDEIIDGSTYLRKQLENKQISIVPAFYDTVSGRVVFHRDELETDAAASAVKANLN